jgi:predicted ATPase/DNA-binding XRE family transcriptional regulator
MLKRRRQEHGLTQDELAERVGCATQTIRKIENGQRRPSYQMADRLAQVLRLSPEERAVWMSAVRAAAEPAPPEAHEAPARPAYSLPAYLTPFVGREEERAELMALLEAPGCRLVTVFGPGGIGKTRLAVEVARAATGFPDGVVFVPLAPLSGPAAIAPAISAALGSPPSSAADPLEPLVGHLGERRALLVLDNLEHLLDPDGVTLGMIGDLLARAPRVSLLVTSRERLQLQAEWVLEIAGLATPPADAAPRPADYPALALFLEHAQRAQHRFQLTPENAQAAATICRLVGGMPLAIELAAAWADTLSCAEIARELRRSLELLASASPERPQRHRSLAAVLDQTWERLQPAARLTLARLSIFPGGFEREVAAYVARATAPQLALLVRHAVLRRADDGYVLHPLVRQYAALRLRELGERERVAERFVGYYLALAAEAGVAYRGPEQTRWRAALASEADKLRWALAMAFEQENLLAVARLCIALRRYWQMRGEGREMLALTERALAHPALPAGVRPALLVALSHLRRNAGQWAAAAEAADAALAAARHGDDQTLLADALYARAVVHNVLGEAEEATPLLEECLAIYTAAGVQDGALRAQYHLANSDFDLGRVESAIARFREVAERAAAFGLMQERLEALGSLGLIAVTTGDVEGISACREVLPEFLRRRNFEVAAYCLDALGAQAGLRGGHRYGCRLIGAAEALRQLSGAGVSPGNEALHARCIADARGPLSDAAFAAAAAEGAALVRLRADGQVDIEPLLALAAPPAQVVPAPEAPATAQSAR